MNYIGVSRNVSAALGLPGILRQKTESRASPQTYRKKNISTWESHNCDEFSRRLIMIGLPKSLLDLRIQFKGILDLPLFFQTHRN
jgi:hypothetical protein